MKKSILTSLCVLFIAGTALGDWDVGDGHKMHWPQLPDLESTGMDIDMSSTPLADDWQCSGSGPVSDIHFWGSFAGDILPENGVCDLTFQISIYDNVPADGSIPWSRPGEQLWTQQFDPGQYSARMVADDKVEDWYDPVTGVYLPDNHLKAFQYNFLIEEEPFNQKEGTIYWLEIKHILPPTHDPDYTFGWKTSLNHWEDDSVYWKDNQPAEWTPMVYPDGHNFVGTTIDLAFVITPEPATVVLFGIGGLMTFTRRKRHTQMA